MPGFSHNADYLLFRLGETASPAVQEFAETGGTDALDKLQQSIQSTNDTNATSSHTNGEVVLDGFTSPPITQGVGVSRASLFLDGNHTLVRESLVSNNITSLTI